VTTLQDTAFWAIAAQIEYTDDRGWTCSRSVPTFYLNEDVQGILNEDDAVNIAREVIDATGLAGKHNGHLYVTAVKVRSS